jgi:hypothetical protein
LLLANTKAYYYYTDAVRQKGYDLDGRDRQAVREVNYPIPDISLLRARLLYDGGNYEKALSQLSGKDTEDFKLLRDKIEYNYRLGRIYDLSLRDDLALKYYQLALDLGKNEHYYFASNAAVRMTAVNEKKRDVQKAKYYYNTAINMEDHDYENSIENKAKEGLKRLRD